MKTAMQELLSQLNDCYEMCDNEERKFTYGIIIKHINHTFLKEEKQQIIDAFTSANTIDQQGTLDSEQYYNETFNK